MEAKEKATELIIIFQYLTLDLKKAINCALICVNEILETRIILTGVENCKTCSANDKEFINDGNYWNDVKEEISKLK